MSETAAVEAFLRAQEEEYGTWVAIAPIDHGGVRAYNPGDAVPVSNVALHKYDEQGLVARREQPAEALTPSWPLGTSTTGSSSDDSED